MIPEISDKKLNKLVKRIRPVIRKDGKLYYIKKVDPRTVSFIWDPHPKKQAKGLKEITTITTYHDFGYPLLFKPSIAEVLAQIPNLHIDDVVAFEIADVDDSGSRAAQRGYHMARTTLYGAK